MSTVTAYLGPTNTGKTYLALTEAASHASACCAFPLRLLAREAYERLCERLGPDHVGLLTGEEHILPLHATHICCTTEAFPRHQLFDCVVIDEVQFAAHPIRGHHFTWALEYARGTEATLWLGAPHMADVLLQLEPNVSIERCPRLSRLEFDGAKNIAKLPPKTAVIAFSIEHVYMLAAQLTSIYGGCAVVLGQLSPKTRRAQVRLFEEGQVDYLVATDAIGHGLNLPLKHVAFAGQHKFDGQQYRPLHPDEIAQIAGRAGRYKQDGSYFMTNGQEPFSSDMIRQVGAHQFQPIRRLRWRSGQLDFNNLDTLASSLKQSPTKPFLQLNQHMDQEILSAFHSHFDKQVRSTDKVKQLWALAQTPDYLKIGFAAHLKKLLHYAHHLVEHHSLAYDAFEQVYRGLVIQPTQQYGIDQALSAIRDIRFHTSILHQKQLFSVDTTQLCHQLYALENIYSQHVHEGLVRRYVESAGTIRKRKHQQLPLRLRDNLVCHLEEPIARVRGLWLEALKPELQLNRIWSQVTQHHPDLLDDRIAALKEAPLKEFHLTDDRLHWQRLPLATIKIQQQIDIQRIRTSNGTLHLTPNARIGEVDRLIHQHGLRFLRKHFGAWFVPDWTEESKLSAPARRLLFELRVNGGATLKKYFSDEIQELTPIDRTIFKSAGFRFGFHTVFHPHIKLKSLRALLYMTADRREDWQSLFTQLDGRAVIPRQRYPKGVRPVRLGYFQKGEYLIRLSFLEAFISEAYRPPKKFSTWQQKWQNRLGLDGTGLAAILPKQKKLSSIRRKLKNTDDDN